MKNGIEFLKQSWKAAAFCLLAVLSVAGQQAALVAGEIHDPSTGAVWALMRDDVHPGGPARWVLVVPGNGNNFSPADRKLLIHAGDRIVVEEHSAVADARLAAIALTSAAKGESLQVRMVIGGAVVTASAMTTTVAGLVTKGRATEAER